MDCDFFATEMPRFADIDQCVFTAQVRTTFHGEDKPEGERGSFYVGFSTPAVIRNVKPFPG